MAAAFRAAFDSTQSSYAVRALMAACCRVTSSQGLSVPETVALSQFHKLPGLYGSHGRPCRCNGVASPAPWFSVMAFDRMWPAGVFGHCSHRGSEERNSLVSEKTARKQPLPWGTSRTLEDSVANLAHTAVEQNASLKGYAPPLTAVTCKPFFASVRPAVVYGDMLDLYPTSSSTTCKIRFELGDLQYSRRWHSTASGDGTRPPLEMALNRLWRWHSTALDRTRPRPRPRPQRVDVIWRMLAACHRVTRRICAPTAFHSSRDKANSDWSLIKGLVHAAWLWGPVISRSSADHQNIGLSAGSIAFDTTVYRSALDIRNSIPRQILILQTRLKCITVGQT
ncbi:hypothetical protein E2P81_ATG05412 [Venturia nashicola]|nr:hypothetical protein E2P81_ATG05412 [Venturia nashicola]